MEPLPGRSGSSENHVPARDWTVVVALAMGIISLALIFMIFWL